MKGRRRNSLEESQQARKEVAGSDARKELAEFSIFTDDPLRRRNYATSPEIDVAEVALGGAGKSLPNRPCVTDAHRRALAQQQPPV
jgi:hypothetical protein